MKAYGAGSAGELADLGIAANPVGVFNVSFPASSEHDEGGAAAEQAETELVFDLGAPQRGATAGGPPLRLCWERPGAEGHAAVEVGLLVLLENDCAAPVVADATNPPCSAGGVVVPHLGACSTRCEEGFDASVASLECAAGVLSPATFECYKRCLVPPVVAGAGGAQEQCSDMPHDSVCSPDCADGHVPSGDFVCRDGFWDHRPNPNLSGDLLYAVPRCYQPCGKTEFPSVAGTTTDVCPGHSGSVPHGGTCPTNCDADHTAFSADGSRSLGESQCRDGGFEPAAFVCRRRCDAPVVAHAVNLQTCQGTPHGQGCELQCAYGHRKTGDLYCQDGEFSPAECKRPCDLSAQWPQGLPNAHGQMCSGVAEDLLLPHGSTCVPACLLGYSNSDEAAYPTCDDGVLLPAAVECHADCTTPPIQGLIPGAQDLSVVCSGLRHGESCPLLCEEGFTSFGRIDCVHGEFVAGTCQRNCMALPAISGSANVDHCYGTGHGETCEVRCREGFAWQGDARCSDGAWEALELCSSPCHAGDAPGPQAHAPAVLCAEGEVIMHGEACTFRCGEGYTTDAVAQCSNGTLEPSTYACTAVASYACGPASDVPGISPADATACAGTGHNAWCMVFCTDGFERTADLLCMHGQWNEPCSDLRPQCGPPPAIPHGRPSNECPFLVGSFCPVVCDAGFAPGTVTGFTCGADLGWSADVSCIRTTCGLPTPPAHGSMTCNGVAEASSCQVACDEGYGPGGELVCSQDGDGVWTWVTYTSAGAEGGALCLPLPCADVPYVPGVSLHSCGSTPHASTCAAFSCRDSLVPTGTYRCRNGLFVELPSCLPASASGVASVPAVLFQLKVELVAEWGDLPPSDSWGEVASDLVALALSRALLQEEGDPGEVLLLGWSANEVASEPAEDQLLVGAGGGAPRSLRSPRFSLRAAPRRLAGAGVGLEILAAVAAEAAPGSGVVQDAGSDADAFAEAMAGRVAALTPSVLAFFVTNEPKLIGYGGEVDLVFASVGLPRRTRLDRPAPTTTPPATRTATRTTRPPATTTTTTRTTLYEPEVSAFERFVTESRHAIVAGVAFLCLVSTVIVCLVIRRRNGRLMKTAKDEPSYTRRRKKNLVKAPKRGSCVMNKADLHTVVQEELSKLKEEQALKKAKLCREAPPAGRRNSQKHQDAQEALRAQVMAAVQVGNIAHAHTRQVVVKHEVPLYDQLRQANRPEHLAYFIRSQAQKDKPGTEVPEDWVRLSTEGEPQNADWESLRITIRATRRASVLEKRESTKKEAAEKAESESEHSDTRSEGVQSDARSDEMQSDAARQDSHQEDAQSEHGAMAGVLQLPAHLRRKAGPAITDSPMEMRDAEAKPEAEGEEDRPEDGNQGAAPDKEPDDREACASEVAEAEGEGAVPAAHADERRVYVSEDVEVHDVHGAQQGQEEDEEEEEEDDDTDSEDSDQPKIRKRWCKKKKAASGRKANPHCMHHFAYRSHVTVDAAEERLPNFHRVIERAEDDDLTRTGRRLDSKMSSSSASSYGSKSSHRKRARDHRKTWEFDTFPVTLAPALHDARRRSDPVMR